MQLVIPETEKQRVKTEMLACGITARQQRAARNLMFEGGLEWLGLEEGGDGPPLMGARLRCVRVVDQPGTCIGDGLGSGSGRGLVATAVGAGGGGMRSMGGP